MDIDYFRKINNTYKSESRQETDLYLLNRHVNRHFADTIDYHKVLKNGETYELLIIKDTDGNTHKKKIKSRPDKKFNLGDYIEWNGQYWLVTLVDPNDKTYNSGYMYLCTVLLKWQNSRGEIIERWAYAEDYTKYSTGISQNYSMSTGDYQYGITLPVDDETKFLKRDKRFVVDIDGVYPPDVYKLTNRKIYLADDRYFCRGGILSLTLSFDVFNASTDKLVANNQNAQVWICDYIENLIDEPSYTNPSMAAIVGKIINTSGFITLNRTKKIKAEFTDAAGNIVTDIVPQWNIVCDFKDRIEISETDNIVSLKITDDNFIGETITVVLKNKNGSDDSIDLIVTDI